MKLDFMLVKVMKSFGSDTAGLFVTGCGADYTLKAELFQRNGEQIYE